MKKFKFIKSILVIIFLALLPAGIFSQNITNTLGNNGIFTVKDSDSIYLSLNKTGGLSINRNIILPKTSNNAGIIYKENYPFIHDYRPNNGIGNNVFMGNNPGNFTMNASDNIGIGSLSLHSVTNGSFNCAVGSNSMYSNTAGVKNSAFGLYTLFANTTGSFNSTFGSNSLQGNTSGSFNSSFGMFSLLSNTTGENNCAFGYRALLDVQYGHGNSAFGTNALENVLGSRNTAVGDSAGRNLIMGDNNIMIGYNSLASSNAISNQITLGNSQHTTLRCNVQSITSLSDRRDKKNISDLEIGLDFISSLKPRSFYWDRREWYDDNVSDGSKMQQTPTAGFIAQELDEAQTEANAGWLNLVLKDNPDKMEATYGNLIPVMVKAIQELKEKNEKLEIQIQEMRNAMTVDRSESEVRYEKIY